MSRSDLVVVGDIEPGLIWTGKVHVTCVVRGALGFSSARQRAYVDGVIIMS